MSSSYTFPRSMIIDIPHSTCKIHPYLQKKKFNSREKILQTLADAYLSIRKNKMPFFVTDELALSMFTTTKIDVKKGVKRVPNQAPLYLDGEDLKKHDFCIYTYTPRVLNVMSQIKVSIDNFTFLKVIANGLLGPIFLVKHKSTSKLHAMKCYSKQDIITTQHLMHSLMERQLLELFKHPFILKLDYAFQTADRVFLVSPFCQGGDLFWHLKKEKRFKEERAKFYAACLTLTLEYIHSQNYIYRDLKPGNILVYQDGYIMLTDLSLSKKIVNNQLSYSFVGTPDYVAPEMIAMSGHGRMLDWWLLGIIVYEMLIGITPFYCHNQGQMFEQIQEKEPIFPNFMLLSNESKDFISQLLRKDPKDRLGNKKDAEDIKNHPWFRDINFQDLYDKKIVAPYLPYFTSSMDTSFFEEQITSQEPELEQIQSDIELLNNFQEHFCGIDYEPEL